MNSAVSQRLWVKKNKKEFAKRLIRESGAVPDSNPSAVFMAGLPGAGKTEFMKNLIAASELKVVRLDMDEIATQVEGYSPDKADRFRASASELLNKTFDLTLKQKLDFMMDGTFGSAYALKNIKRTLDKGYKIKVIYIHQDPKIAWDFTVAREEVEHRAIDIDGFIATYFRIIENLGTLMRADYGIIVIDTVIKDKHNKVGEWRENVEVGAIDELLENCYNKETLKEYINGR